MSDQDKLSDVKKGVSIIKDIMEAAGNDPKAKEAASKIGESAVILASAVKNCLLPLAAMNFGFEKAEIYFREKFQDELNDATADIPPEFLTEPKASVAGSALQGLSLSHDEPSLKELYLSLLSTAMDKRKGEDAHPAFAEILKQLSPSEAVILKIILSTPGRRPICQIHIQETENSSLLLFTHVIELYDSKTGKPAHFEYAPVYIDNWIRLGLVNVLYPNQLTGSGVYDWVQKTPEFIESLKTYAGNDIEKLAYVPGTLSKSEFGKKFANAVGIDEDITCREHIDNR